MKKQEEFFLDIPLVEEPEEEVENLIVQPYTSSEESTMAREGEGEVKNGEERRRIGEVRSREGNRGDKGGRGGRGDD